MAASGEGAAADLRRWERGEGWTPPEQLGGSQLDLRARPLLGAHEVEGDGIHPRKHVRRRAEGWCCAPEGERECERREDDGDGKRRKVGELRPTATRCPPREPSRTKINAGLSSDHH